MKNINNKYWINIVITAIAITIMLKTKNEEVIKIAQLVIIIGNLNIISVLPWSLAEKIRESKGKRKEDKK